MVASLTAAAQKRGLIMYDKHFFLNDTEQDRDQTGLLTYATEQTIREVYMKVEQIVVEEADAMALMTAFNRIGNVWVGEDYRTLTNILRGEWGFKGMNITDGQNGYMKNARMIRGGGDMALAMLGRIDMDVTSDLAKNDSTNIYCLREAAKNILYVVAQSNVMNHVTTYADDTAARNDLGCYMPGDNVDADKLTAASDLFDGVVYELCDGKLPEGLTLNADGTVTGTIAADTADGVYSFKVAVKDGDEFIGWQVAWFQVTVGKLKQIDNYVGAALPSRCMSSPARQANHLQSCFRFNHARRIDPCVRRHGVWCSEAVFCPHLLLRQCGSRRLHRYQGDGLPDHLRQALRGAERRDGSGINQSRRAAGFGLVGRRIRREHDSDVPRCFQYARGGLHLYGRADVHFPI